MIPIDQEEIIEVTADFLGRIHARVDIKLFSVREGRENIRKHRFLDLVRHAKLCSDPLFFRCHSLDLLQIQNCLVGKIRKRLCQCLDLVSRTERILHLEFQIGFTQFEDPVCDRIERLYDFLRQNQRIRSDRNQNQQNQKQGTVPGTADVAPICTDRLLLDLFVILLNVRDGL